jgi:hypothetical protein
MRRNEHTSGDETKGQYKQRLESVRALVYGYLELVAELIDFVPLVNVQRKVRFPSPAPVFKILVNDGAGRAVGIGDCPEIQRIN